MQHQIKLIHISDLHFAIDHMSVMDMARAEGLLSKRVLGWMNHRMNRKGSFPAAIRDRLSNYLQQSDWDYLIITGDFTNLSLKAEMELARKWLEPFIQKGPVLLTPGNHDRYVPKALKPDLLKQYFGDCFPFASDSSKDEDINYLEISDKAVLFEIDMAVPRKLFSSRGRIKADLAAFHKLIKQKYENHTKIVIGHYPVILPPEVSDIYLHQLADKIRMERFLNDMKIDIYLHGHIHKSWQLKNTSGHPVVHISSGGCLKNESGPWAGFHQITLTDNTFKVQKIII